MQKKLLLELINFILSVIVFSCFIQPATPTGKNGIIQHSNRSQIHLLFYKVFKLKVRTVGSKMLIFVELERFPRLW